MSASDQQSVATQVQTKMQAELPSLPSSWYRDGAAAATAQVERECAMPVPLHHHLVTTSPWPEGNA